MMEAGSKTKTLRAKVLDEGARRFGVVSVLLIEVTCILKTLFLLVTGKIGMPTEEVGRMLTFADGSTARIYRETKQRLEIPSDPVLVVVRFRLRLIGTNRLGHALFRFESLFNTLLFAAHRGFKTKLWLTDTVTGFYRGIYEWEGAQSATDYAEVLRVVLAPWVVPGSFGYRIVAGAKRESLLEGSVTVGVEAPSEELWWLPVETRGNEHS